MSASHVRCFCTVVPPHILREIVARGTTEQRAWGLRTLAHTERLRGQRDAFAALAPRRLSEGKQRAIYDAQHRTALPGRLVRDEGSARGRDVTVNEAYDGSGAVHDFFRKIYQRESIDDRGLRLDATVHYDRRYDNAFWNGVQMVYGDGDGRIFQRFTRSIDVIGHELTHGVTQHEAGLDYQDQPGALNESFSDVFGSLVKQWLLKQTAVRADWLIGAELFTAKVKGVALRSMKAPGTAYDDPLLGKDPQPGHMRDFDKGRDDNGGVHINSGIPNRAFYLAATGIGGFAWERTGRIWYLALRDRLRHNARFVQAAAATMAVAEELYGAKSKEQAAIRNAWQKVGVIP